MIAKLRIKHYTPQDLTGFLRVLTNNGYKVEIERNNTVSTGVTVSKNVDEEDSPHILDETDFIELRDRFGDWVSFVVRDMVSGKGKRWEDDAVSQMRSEDKSH